MANFDRAFIDQVLSSTDIVDVINEKVNLTKNGANFKGLCPFHNEKTPSFNVSSSKQFYHCFGCGAHGDAIKFLQEHDNLTFIEALTKLAQAANLELPEKTKKNDAHYNLFISNKLAADFYSRSLKNNSKANTYLESRGIDQAMIDVFHLGLSNNKWDDLTNLFAKEKIMNNAVEAGLIIKSNNKTYDRFRNRIMFPIRNSTGNIIGFGARIYNSDDGAKYDKVIKIDADEIVPQVTWGTSPEDVVSINGNVPDPAKISDSEKQKSMFRALEYMGLEPNTNMTDIKIDKVFIGSCTNGRIEDLRAVSKIADGRKVAEHVNAIIVPGSGLVKKQAEKEGLDKIFIQSGFEWRDPGCSMCLAMNADKLKPKERCASTSNRNFEGRQGRGGRTHLMSPAMAAAAAIKGKLSDCREF